jgi:hypothetical protein
MADAVGDRLKRLDAEAAAVTQQLAKVDEELFGETPPSGERLQLLKEKRQGLVKKDESLNEMRRLLTVAFAGGAPPCAWACTLPVCEL